MNAILGSVHENLGGTVGAGESGTTYTCGAAGGEVKTMGVFVKGAVVVKRGTADGVGVIPSSSP
jgi:hypothetical protein